MTKSDHDLTHVIPRRRSVVQGAMWSVPVVVAAAAAPMASASPAPDMTVNVAASDQGNGSFLLTFNVANVGDAQTTSTPIVVDLIVTGPSWTETGPPVGTNWTIADNGNGTYTATWVGGPVNAGGSLDLITWSGFIALDVPEQGIASAAVLNGSGGELNHGNNYGTTLFGNVVTPPARFDVSISSGPCNPPSDPSQPSVVEVTVHVEGIGNATFTDGDVVTITPSDRGTVNSPPTDWAQNGTLSFAYTGSSGSSGVADFVVSFVTDPGGCYPLIATIQTQPIPSNATAQICPC